LTKKRERERASLREDLRPFLPLKTKKPSPNLIPRLKMKAKVLKQRLMQLECYKLLSKLTKPW